MKPPLPHPPKPAPAPFPYFGGKRLIAAEVWRRVGRCRMWIEPFCGSAAVTLAAPPGSFHHAVLNDIDPFITNIWRALKWRPGEVAQAADMPLDHATMHALRAEAGKARGRLAEQMLESAEACDPVLAGRSCWLLAAAIGDVMSLGGKPSIAPGGGVANAVPKYATPGGFGNQADAQGRKNAARERLVFSPAV